MRRLLQGKAARIVQALLWGCIIAPTYAQTFAARAANGEALYRARCSACHDSGTGQAPRVGVAAEWKERFARGRAALHEAAIKGVFATAMAPRGGFADLSDAQVRAAVDHMLARTGFVEAQGVATTAMALPAAPASVPSAAPADPAGASDGEVTRAVAEALRAALASSPSAIESYQDELTVRGAGIRVGVRDGVVRLMGVVQNAAVVKRAQDIAGSVAGVRAVDNKLVTGGMLDFD